jgi:hypothetical protein
MNSLDDTGVVAGPTSHTHRLRGLAATGFIATLAAMAATTLAAALAQAAVMIPLLARSLRTSTD